MFEPLKKQVADLQKERTDFDNAIPTTLVMADMAQARETFTLIRGAYNKKGDKVTAGVPAIFPPIPKDAPLNRLGLAKWLVDPGHPLTAQAGADVLAAGGNAVDAAVGAALVSWVAESPLTGPAGKTGDDRRD